jgi:hypothetical protein
LTGGSSAVMIAAIRYAIGFSGWGWAATSRLLP